MMFFSLILTPDTLNPREEEITYINQLLDTLQPKRHLAYMGSHQPTKPQTLLTTCEAKDALKALKFKLENVAYGGGAQALLLHRVSWFSKRC